MALAGYILAGGKNSRMNGKKKSELIYREETFLTHIARALGDIKTIYLSVEAKEPYESLGFPCITDIYPEIGPMGGIYSGLTRCKEDALFVLSCDTPCITNEVVQKIISGYNEKKRPVVIKTGEKIHPLIGVYPKAVLPFMEEMIRKENYRMMYLVKQCGFDILELEELKWKQVININDPDSYKRLQKEMQDTDKWIKE